MSQQINHTTNVTFLVTHLERDRLNVGAIANGVSLNTYCRWMLNLPTELDGEVNAELKGDDDGNAT